MNHPKDILVPFEDLIGPKSILPFQLFKIDPNFLKIPPRIWPEMAEYEKVQKLLSSIKCVNDYSERLVKPMTDYNTFFTKDENEKQDL